ncbi:MAG: DUF4397 domain-containing protein [Anaerolineae bacterium]|nr:DUF4397 domain-containing protein [Anaerolineae bacterium]
MRRLIVLCLIPVLAVLGLAACGGGDDGGTPAAGQPTTTASPSPVPPTPTFGPTWTPFNLTQAAAEDVPRAQLSVVHANADLPGVDFYVDDSLIAPGFSAGLYLSQPVTLPPGQHTLHVMPSRTLPGDGEALLSEPFELADDQSAIMFLVGTADSAQAVFLTQDLSALPANTARVNVIHAVPRGPAIEVQQDSMDITPALEFGALSEYVAVDSGPSVFSVVSGTEMLASLDLNVQERFTYTLIVMPNASGDGVRIVELRTPVHSETLVRLIHASPNTPPVDVYLGNELAAIDLAFQSWEDGAAFRSQSTTLRVVPAGEPDAVPILQKQISLLPHAAVDLVLVDVLERLTVVPVQRDLSPTPFNAARYTFLNAAVGTQQVAVLAAGTDTGIPSIPFGQALLPMLFEEQTIEYDFTTADGETPREVDHIPDREWPAGFAYTIIVTGYPNTSAMVLETEVGTSTMMAVADDSGNLTVVKPSEEMLGDDTYFRRIVNALANGGAIDIELDGEVVFSNVERSESSPYIVRAEEQNELVIRDSLTGAVLLQDVLTWGDGHMRTLFVLGDRAGIKLNSTPDSGFDIGYGYARIRVLHNASNQPGDLLLSSRDPFAVEAGAAGPEAGEVTPEGGEGEEIEVVTPAPEPEPLGDVARFETPGEEYDIIVGTYTVYILNDITFSTLHTVPNVTFQEGVFYDILIQPDANGVGLDMVIVPHFD